MADSSQSSVLERFLVGFEGTSLPHELKTLLQQSLAGVAIFARNYENLEGLRHLTSEIRRVAGRPVLIGVDQEGGTQFALQPPFTVWPSPSEVGLLHDTPLVVRMAQTIARELAAVGCNLDFAPMLDLATNPESPVTKQRSFGADARKVGRMGVAFIRGLESGGALACAKHFPGHGDTQVDPHQDLPVFQGNMKRLNDVEFVPFVKAIGAGVPLIMTAHILLPQIDPERPASLSRKMLAQTLRQQMKFGGVILADDLGMGAIAQQFGPSEAAVEALGAGADLAMLCHDWSAVLPAVEGVEKGLQQGQFNPAEWQASHLRIERLRAAVDKRPAPALEIVGCQSHRALASKLREAIAEARTKKTVV